jgi:hypothetical protein
MIDDVMKALDRWAEWGPIRAAPAKIEALEKRVAELERKLNGKWPPDVYKGCGERQLRMSSQYPLDRGALVNEEWKCAACGKGETRITKHA